jgi:hypothetical protein
MQQKLKAIANTRILGISAERHFKTGGIMAIIVAKKTKAAIDAMLEADQGARYRTTLKNVIPHMGDAYRGADDGFRSHLGASQIGKVCDRALWYGFRWAVKPKFIGRMLRLFNRGHLEEARFIALLLSIDVKVWQQDANGNQFRISEFGGHFGGSGDGVGMGIPDIELNSPCVLEFKTHNDKSFKKLITDGVKAVKLEHWVQMQSYMRKMGIPVALYGAANKNDDELYFEIVHLDTVAADIYIQRAHTIIFTRTPPDKIHDSTGWYECKYCDQNTVCHLGAEPARNCRTCHFVSFEADGTVACRNPFGPKAKQTLTKEDQLSACTEYEKF